MPPQQRQNARFTFQEAFSKHSVAVMSAPGRDPDPTVSRSSCKQGHHTEVLRNAVAKLVRNMDLPGKPFILLLTVRHLNIREDLATRRGLKSCYRNFDSIIDSLLAKATQHDGHVSAAAAIVLCRICRDPCLAEMVQDESARWESWLGFLLLTTRNRLCQSTAELHSPAHTLRFL